eukprot:Clim_evm16s84 gene=Clim_evmTU16s84
MADLVDFDPMNGGAPANGKQPEQTIKSSSASGDWLATLVSDEGFSTPVNNGSVHSHNSGAGPASPAQRASMNSFHQNGSIHSESGTPIPGVVPDSPVTAPVVQESAAAPSGGSLSPDPAAEQAIGMDLLNTHCDPDKAGEHVRDLEQLLAETGRTQRGVEKMAKTLQTADNLAKKKRRDDEMFKTLVGGSDQKSLVSKYGVATPLLVNLQLVLKSEESQRDHLDMLRLDIATRMADLAGKPVNDQFDLQKERAKIRGLSENYEKQKKKLEKRQKQGIPNSNNSLAADLMRDAKGELTQELLLTADHHQREVHAQLKQMKELIYSYIQQLNQSYERSIKQAENALALMDESTPEMMLYAYLLHQNNQNMPSLGRQGTSSSIPRFSREPSVAHSQSGAVSSGGGLNGSQMDFSDVSQPQGFSENVQSPRSVVTADTMQTPRSMTVAQSGDSIGIDAVRSDTGSQEFREKKTVGTRLKHAFSIRRKRKDHRDEDSHSVNTGNTSNTDVIVGAMNNREAVVDEEGYTVRPDEHEVDAFRKALEEGAKGDSDFSDDEDGNNALRGIPGYGGTGADPVLRVKINNAAGDYDTHTPRSHGEDSADGGESSGTASPSASAADDSNITPAKAGPPPVKPRPTPPPVAPLLAAPAPSGRSRRRGHPPAHPTDGSSTSAKPDVAAPSKMVPPPTMSLSALNIDKTGSVESINVDVAVVETLHAFFKGGSLANVQLLGEVMLNFPAGTASLLEGLAADPIIKMRHQRELPSPHTNDIVSKFEIEADDDDEQTDEDSENDGSGVSKLHLSRELLIDRLQRRGNDSSSVRLTVASYRSDSLADSDEMPVRLAFWWETEDNWTPSDGDGEAQKRYKVRTYLKFHERYQTDSSNEPVEPLEVQVALPVKVDTDHRESSPEAEWDKSMDQLRWKVLSPTDKEMVMLQASFTAKDPSAEIPSASIWARFVSQQSLFGMRFLDGPGAKLGRHIVQLKSGKYFASA